MIRRAVLQLNACYEATRIVSMKKALTLITKGVAVVEVPTTILIHPGLGIYAPSVIRLRNYRHVPIRLQVTSRKNIFLRDSYRCNYCGYRFRPQELTLDHIIPKSKGGSSAWDNLTAACKNCNHRKGDRSLDESGMKLLRRPLPQTIHTPRHLLRSLGNEVAGWGPYLWNDSEGEKSLQFVN